LNGLQHILIAGANRQNSDNRTGPATVTQSTVQANYLQTNGEPLSFMRPDLRETAAHLIKI
jgi:hypothetical protein